jgi:hypothetical protein
MAILNADGVDRAVVTAELRLLCFNADGEAVVLKSQGHRRGTPGAYDTAFWWMTGPTAEEVKRHNNGQRRPHNAYIRVYLSDVAIFEALATQRSGDGLRKPDGETYWFDDNSRVVSLDAPADGAADESADGPADEPADEGDGIDWASLPESGQQAKRAYDAAIAAAARDCEVAKRVARDESEAGIGAAAEQLREQLRTAFRAALEADDFDDANRLKNAVAALTDYPTEDLTRRLGEEDLAFTTGGARRAMMAYRDRLTALDRTLAGQDQAADEAFGVQATAAQQQLLEDLAVAYRAAVDADQLDAALALKETVALIRGDAAPARGGSDVAGNQPSEGDVVYLDEVRPPRWVRRMYDKYHDQIAEIDGEYYDIGESRLAKPRLVTAAAVGTWVLVPDARVQEIVGPNEMIVRVLPQAVKTREWRYGQMVDVYEAHPAQILIVETDTSGYGDDHRFFGGLIVVAAGQRPRVRPYEPLSREQFVEAINSGLRLVTYSYNRRRGVVQRPEE